MLGAPWQHMHGAQFCPSCILPGLISVKPALLGPVTMGQVPAWGRGTMHGAAPQRWHSQGCAQLLPRSQGGGHSLATVQCAQHPRAQRMDRPQESCLLPSPAQLHHTLPSSTSHLPFEFRFFPCSNTCSTQRPVQHCRHFPSSPQAKEMEGEGLSAVPAPCTRHQCVARARVPHSLGNHVKMRVTP